MEYIPRHITPFIKESARYYPIISLTGPRQSGKSTLLRNEFPDLPYYSLENPDTLDAVIADPRAFLDQHSSMIIDEAQRYPRLFSYLQGIVDDNSQRRFFLSGSSNFALLKSITQSLAGRVAIFELLPLSIAELNSAAIAMGTDPQLMRKGFFPGLWRAGTPPTLFYRNYVKTYLERDVRQIVNVRDLDAFRLFLRMCAARAGSLFVASEVAGEVGVAVNTVRQWLSVLEASYLVFMQQPYFANIRKRLTRTPKLQFVDPGLAAYLLDIDGDQVMARDRMYGHLFENMVVIEAVKRQLNNAREVRVNFYRDSNGVEADLLTYDDRKMNIYEIKSSHTYHPEFAKGVRAVSEALRTKVDIGRTGVIYAGAPEAGIALNYREIEGMI